MRKRGLIPVLVAVLAACGGDSPGGPLPPLPDPSCEGYYGAPNERTGLGMDTCFAWIEGDVPWTPRAWDAASIAELRSWTLENPPEVPTEDPYVKIPPPQHEPDAVCAFFRTGEHTYRLETFESVVDAELAGGIVTHGFACGTCSALDDLAAYAETPDQTDPVRQCTLDTLGGTVEELADCIENAVGFTPPCARTWAYNGKNDARKCYSVCVAHLDSPYNQPDGSLNPCLQCDEDNSGPVFKAVAGRLRRSSGLAAAICRPCESVWRVDHNYE